jgi:hypothetical protein
MLTGMTKWMAAASVAACMCTVGAQAQMAMKADNKTMAKPASGDKAGRSFDDLLGLAEQEIVANAEAMPADKYDFAPSKAIFKEGQTVDFTSPKPVSTFGEMVKHLTGANYYFFATAENKPGAELKGLKDLKTKEQIVAALKESFAFAHKSVSAMTVANGFDETESEGHKTTRAAAFAFGLMHMNDHYGQLNEYLRMNGIVPPASRK